ncbi:MAG: alpha-L-fucosidase, partial [Lentisphaeria bacterium]|nr:alpha-L-fucosidase [Lentisphaeria bacterium]NQZ69794.1 alpha-L-fucosidase [Lentisphaeria bacterium]
MNTQTQEAPSMNDNWFEKTTRKVHIDFHTPEFPEEAIQNFDADKFINTIVDANFQAAVLFTKCHHGNSYYNTSVGHKHSGMSGDMFGEQIKAARKKGLKVFAYYSVGWDERSIAENPDWGLVTAAGESCFYKHWQWMCINSPYTTELILPQLKEIVTQYEPDGLWLDILSGGCCCAYCQDQHMAAYGREVDRDDASYLKWIKSSRKKFLQDVKDMATAIKPDIVISANSVGVLEDSRDDCESADFLILESGYSLAGISEEPGGSIDNLIKSKQGQNFDQTLEICSTRFVHSWAAWGDIKPVAQMQIQAAEIIAHGAVLNLGDQASPDGTLEPAVYKTMKQVMDFVAEREDYCIGGKSVASIAVLSHGMDNGLLGASHMLLEMGRHFDLLSDDNLERIHEYEVVLIPERDQLNKNQLS